MDNTQEKRAGIVIEIFDNSSQVTIRDTVSNVHKQELNTVKTVKLESLVKAFQNAETKITTPIIPPNTIKYEEKGNLIYLLLYYEPSHFTATCYKNQYENCARPGLIMKYGLNIEENAQGRTFKICETKCFGVVDDLLLLNENSQLYGLPFPNIGNDGWICWGGNSIGGNFKSLMGIRSYVDRLFKSPFNDHVFNSPLLKNFGISTPESFFTFIQDKPVFPKELLENLGRKYTIGTI